MGACWGKKQCFAALPGIPIHIFPLMSGMEHPLLLRQLGYGTKKSKINGGSVNRAWNSWTLLDTMAKAGQMGTSGSLLQRLNNGRKASKENPIGHCQAKGPRTPNTGLGRSGFSSMGEAVGG